MYTYILFHFKPRKYFPFISFNIHTAFASFMETKVSYSIKCFVEEKTIVKIPIFDWKLNVSHLEHNIDAASRNKWVFASELQSQQDTFTWNHLFYFPQQFVHWSGISLFRSFGWNLHGQIFSTTANFVILCCEFFFFNNI